MVAADDERVTIRPGLQLNVRVWKAADARGPAFVLVHGLASNARLWDGVAERLAAAGHEAVAVDQRGHGRSDAPDDGYDHDTVTDDLRLLVQRRGLQRPVLVGQSWGGNVVLEAAARWPDELSGVAAVDGGTIDLRRRFPEWETCRTQLAPPVFDGMSAGDLQRRLRRAHPGWSERSLAGVWANFVEQPDGTVRPRLRRDRHLRILRAMWDQRPVERYPQIPVPVLLIPADGADDDMPDKRIEVERAMELLPRGRVRWLTGHHDLHAEQPENVAELLLEAVTDGFFD